MAPSRGWCAQARLFLSMHVKSHSTEDCHTAKHQTRTEMVETTAGNLIASPRVGLMLSFDVAWEVGQMERRRSFHRGG
jgi:hypothetical protein